MVWRGFWVSVIGGSAYLGYSIYESRHPVEQMEADPNKKTLVILGAHLNIKLYRLKANRHRRNWMGSCVAPEEARH